MRVKPEDVGGALGSIVLPGAGVRGLVVVLVAVVLAAPWLATSCGLLQVDERAGVVATREVVRLRPELVLLPGGRFTMGSPEGEEGRAAGELLHEVELSPFFMCRTEVTNAHWKAVMGGSPSDCKHGCDDSQPVQRVSWEQATGYMNALTDRENALFPKEPRTRCYEGSTTWVVGCTGYRLPSEAEWEYAVRAGTKTEYSFGDDAKDLCKHGNGADQAAKREHPGWTVSECDDGAAHLAQVGKYMANPWGLYDMHGNVWEWVWDWYGDKYSDNDKVTREARGPQNGDLRALRGGSFYSTPRWLRSASRGKQGPSDAVVDIGFRCARASPPAP